VFNDDFRSVDVTPVDKLADSRAIQEGARLFTNAVEAMSEMRNESRELLISTRIEAGDVTVAVRDTGPGLSDDALDKIFEAFHTTKPTGLGMGLSISRSIAIVVVDIVRECR
jgi:nitrogen fixation/metabolism regulation signal transduction histidine kinase